MYYERIMTSIKILIVLFSQKFYFLVDRFSNLLYAKNLFDLERLIKYPEIFTKKNWIFFFLKKKDMRLDKKYFIILFELFFAVAKST